MYRTSRLSMRIVGIWIIISCHLTAITLPPKFMAYNNIRHSLFTPKQLCVECSLDVRVGFQKLAIPIYIILK